MAEQQFTGLSGRELAAIRKRAGLNQTELARQVGIGRHTVSYWEGKPVVSRHGAARMICDALGVRILPVFPQLMRARGDGVLGGWEAYYQRELARQAQRAAERWAKRRVICGARTRKGTACRNKSEPGKLRCKFHGGKSTGPKTQEGRDRIAEAQRTRWAKWRAGRTLG